MPSSPPKKNTAFICYVGLVSQANTKILQVSPTLAAGDVKVAIDDGAPNNLATLPVVDTDFTKRVKVALSAAEMNGDRISIVFADAAGAEWCDLIIDIATSVRQVDDLAFPVVSGRGIDVDATGGVEITPNQAVNTAQWNGSAVAAPTVAGVPEVDMTHWLGTAAATPTVAGVPEVDVTHLGGAAQSATDLKDFADEGYDPATNKVQGVALTDTLTTYTGNTPQTGDSFARLGAPAGASVSADIAAIEGQTDDIGVAGAGLTAIPWNAAWDAQVESEVDDALVGRNLDKLVLLSSTADSGSTTTLIDTALTQADADWWKGRLIVFTSGTLLGQCAIVTDFNAGTDTLTFAPPVTVAVGTHTYVILPSISVWDDTLAEHLLSGSTGAALNAAGAAGDPWSTALPGAYGAGTAGKIVGDNVNATISSRATPANVAAELATYDGPTFAELDARTDAIDAALVVIDDFVDTEVAAIKAKTDQLTFTGANKVDASILAAGDFAQGAADKVWSTAARALTDKVGFALSAAGIQAIWDQLTSGLTAAGSIGKKLADWVLGSDSKVLLSNNAHTGAVIPTVTTVSGDVSLASADEDAIVNKVWDEAIADHLGAGSTGAALNGAGSAGDPWTTALPGAYGAGTAGNILGNRLDTAMTSRAAPGDLMGLNAAGLAADAVTEIQSGLATAAALTTAQADLDDVQTRLPAALVGGRMSSDAVAISGSAPAADKLELGALAMDTGAAVTGTLSTTEMTTDLTEATDDHYNGRTLLWTSGPLLRQATAITDYVGASKKLVFTAVTEAPVAGDTFIIV
jgi:hypothetical protein